MKSYNLYFFRHGITKGNLNAQYIGHTDLPLTTDSINELHSIKAKYHYPKVDAVFSSPLKRCKDSAEIMFPDNTIITIDDFIEYNFGEFEQCTADDLKDNEDFKETPKGGVIVYNLDNDENRRIFELCYRTHKTLINPLLNWDDEFLWWYIKTNNIPLNPLYGCGQCRVGCIGCPMAGERRWKEFERYPKYKEAYIRAFDKMLIERERRGLKNRDLWKTGIKVFKWWMEDKNIDGQLAFGEDMEIYEAYTDYINFR